MAANIVSGHANQCLAAPPTAQGAKRAATDGAPGCLDTRLFSTVPLTTFAKRLSAGTSTLHAHRHEHGGTGKRFVPMLAGTRQRNGPYSVNSTSRGVLLPRLLASLSEASADGIWILREIVVVNRCEVLI